MTNPKNALSTYYSAVEKAVLLSAEEERALMIRYHTNNDQDAKERIIQGALRYVISEARKHQQCIRDRSLIADMIAAGNIGLLRALEKFNPEVGTRFLTYAGWWVRHEMREESRRISMVHVPSHAISKGVKHPLTTPLDQCAELGNIKDTHDGAERIEMQHSLVSLLELAELDVRAVYVVKACFGIHSKPKTLRQIGALLEITGERVRQIREAALAKLRVVAAENDIEF